MSVIQVYILIHIFVGLLTFILILIGIKSGMNNFDELEYENKQLIALYTNKPLKPILFIGVVSLFWEILFISIIVFTLLPKNKEE